MFSQKTFLLSFLATCFISFSAGQALTESLSQSQDQNSPQTFSSKVNSPCYACSNYNCNKVYISYAKSRSISKLCGNNTCSVRVHISSTGNFTSYITDSVGRNSWYNNWNFVSVSSLSTDVPVPCFEAGPGFVTLGDVSLIIYCKSSAGCDVSYTLDVGKIEDCPRPVCPQAHLTCSTPYLAIGTETGVIFIIAFLVGMAIVGVCFAFALGYLARWLSASNKYPEQIEVEMEENK